MWAALLAVLALAYFLLGGINGKYIFYGFVTAAISVAAFNVYRRLSTPDRTARKLATGAAGLAAIFILLGPGNGGFVVGLGLTLAIPIALWIPADARRFYGDEGEFITRAPQ